MSSVRSQSVYTKFIIFACALVVSPLVTIAQEYKELTTAVPVESRAASRLRNAFKSALLNDTPAPELQQFVDYYLELMTRKSHWGASSTSSKMNPGKLRKEIRTRGLNLAKGEGVHEWMVKEILTRCTEYVTSKEYHPFVRMNAMLLIAELNEKEPAGTKPPVPSPEALDVMLKELESPTQLEAVKLAALVGIERQVKHGFEKHEEGLRLKKIQTNLSRYAQMPGDKTDAKVRWYRRRAIQILGLHGEVGTNGSIVEMLARIAADQNASVIVRSEAANALGKFDTRSTNLEKDLNYPYLCEIYAKLAVDAAAATKGVNADGSRTAAMSLQLKEHIGHLHFAFNGPRVPLSRQDDPELPQRGIFTNKTVPESNNALKSEYKAAFTALYDDVKKGETDAAIDIKVTALQNVMNNNPAKQKQVFLSAPQG